MNYVALFSVHPIRSTRYLFVLVVGLFTFIALLSVAFQVSVV